MSQQQRFAEVTAECAETSSRFVEEARKFYKDLENEQERDVGFFFFEIPFKILTASIVDDVWSIFKKIKTKKKSDISLKHLYLLFQVVNVSYILLEWHRL